MGQFKLNKTSSEEVPLTQFSRDTIKSIIKPTTARRTWGSERTGSLHCRHAQLEYAHRASNPESQKGMLLLEEKRCLQCQVLSETRTIQISFTTCFWCTNPDQMNGISKIFKGGC